MRSQSNANTIALPRIGGGRNAAAPMEEVSGAQDTIYLCNFRVSVDGEWLCLKELQDLDIQDAANNGGGGNSSMMGNNQMGGGLAGGDGGNAMANYGIYFIIFLFY